LSIRVLSALAAISTLGHLDAMGRHAPVLAAVGFAAIVAANQARADAAAPVLVAVCAPGHPGSTAEAQPSMDAFAAAVAEASGWPKETVRAVYEETEEGGVARLTEGGAGIAIVTLPFFVKHGEALKLVPRMQVEQKGTGLTETWSLVAKKARVSSPASLAGFTVASIAGYAPRFVRGTLAAWGTVPEGVKVVPTKQVLSALRRAAAGEDVAVFLDGTQGAALGSLPFAAELEVVARSEPLPAAFVCTVGSKLSKARWKALERGLGRVAAARRLAPGVAR
jgi:hypothetical protein